MQICPVNGQLNSRPSFKSFSMACSEKALDCLSLDTLRYLKKVKNDFKDSKYCDVKIIENENQNLRVAIRLSDDVRVDKLRKIAIGGRYIWGYEFPKIEEQKGLDWMTVIHKTDHGQICLQDPDNERIYYDFPEYVSIFKDKYNELPATKSAIGYEYEKDPLREGLTIAYILENDRNLLNEKKNLLKDLYA